MVNFTPRDARIFRPYPGEVPWPDPDPAWTRVAKLDDVVIGAYEIERPSALRFRIKALWVDPAHRGNGLGRWLLGHAIGTAESQGAREIEAPADVPFYARYGFPAPAEEGGKVSVLILTPE